MIQRQSPARAHPVLHRVGGAQALHRLEGDALERLDVVGMEKPEELLGRCDGLAARRADNVGPGLAQVDAPGAQIGVPERRARAVERRLEAAALGA